MPFLTVIVSLASVIASLPSPGLVKPQQHVQVSTFGNFEPGPARWSFWLEMCQRFGYVPPQGGTSRNKC